MSTTVTKQSWEVIPITKQMNTNGQSIIIQTDPTSQSGKSTNDINQNIQQSQENSKYDNVQGMNVKPLNGGKRERKNMFSLYFKGKEYKYEGEKGMKAKDVVTNFVEKRNLKRECLVRVKENNKNEILFKVRNSGKKNDRISLLY